MPRRPRQEEPGALHHVFARGVAKRAIFRSDADHLLYLRLLEQTVRRCGWLCLAYCLMPNHVHLVVETPEPNLGHGMQRLHGDYATAYNGRHGLSGHVFQGRYGAVRVRTDAQLTVLAAYIALNPVDAQLVQRPEDYAWSSHRGTLHTSEPAWLAGARMRELLAAFGGDPLTRYAERTAPAPVSARGRRRSLGPTADGRS